MELASSHPQHSVLTVHACVSQVPKYSERHVEAEFIIFEVIYRGDSNALSHRLPNEHRCGIFIATVYRVVFALVASNQ